MSATDPKQAVANLKARIIAGEASMTDILRNHPSGDYRAYVDAMRLVSILTTDVEVLKAMRNELDVEIAANPTTKIDDDALAAGFRRKDGNRRFTKLIDHHRDMKAELTPLLSGDFEARLSRYLSLISYVEGRWSSACALFTSGDYAMACFTSILVIEEVGKLSQIYQELIAYDAPSSVPTDAKQIADKDHRRKHFVGVISGALINARLDRVLGKDVVKKILHQAESDELEKLRQSCLYIDFDNLGISTPKDRINMEKACTYVVLSGELMAEVLGYFPWDFERMRDEVIAFERSIGMPEKKIAAH